MRMKRPQGYKTVKGECLCHGQEHKFRVVFRTLHRMKLEVYSPRRPREIGDEEGDYRG